MRWEGKKEGWHERRGEMELHFDDLQMLLLLLLLLMTRDFATLAAPADSNL
jgi:hypothetical protein